MTTVNEDFKQVLLDFQDAADNLLAPLDVVTITGELMELQPLVDQMIEIGGAPARKGYARRTPGSWPPIWLDNLDWQRNLHNALCGLTATTPGLTPRAHLEKAAERRYAPHNTPELRVATAALTSLWWSSLYLLYPPLFTIQAECPKCGARTYIAIDALGQRREQDALTVHDFWGQCAACSAVWWGPQIHDLAMTTKGQSNDTADRSDA